MSTDGASTSDTKEQGKPLYTAYNLWYEKPDAMYSINYKKGTLIPAGTQVESVSMSKKEISFRRVGIDRTFLIQFTPKYHHDVTISEFKDRLFTTKKIQELTKGFTQKELECVKEGVIKSGISKKAVLAAYGYPPEHATASIKENTWKYWLDRFRQTTVNFDDKGLAR